VQQGEAEVVVCFTWPAVDRGGLAMCERVADVAQLASGGPRAATVSCPRWEGAVQGEKYQGATS
jgi:uncharacterized protein YodC (DUF2158 family)